MAAISRRPRLAQIAVLALALIAAACSLVKPAETTPDKQEHAARLVHDGKHADAARVYADLALQLPAESDNYELLSAEQWVAAGNVAAAKQALAQVSPEARTKLADCRARLSPPKLLMQKTTRPARFANSIRFRCRRRRNKHRTTIGFAAAAPF